MPNPAFPTFGNADGGFEVYISEGFAHVDVADRRGDVDNNVLAPLSASSTATSSNETTDCADSLRPRNPWLRLRPPNTASSITLKKQSTSVKPMSRSQPHCVSSGARMFACLSRRVAKRAATSSRGRFAAARLVGDQESTISSSDNASPHAPAEATCSTFTKTPPGASSP